MGIVFSLAEVSLASGWGGDGAAKMSPGLETRSCHSVILTGHQSRSCVSKALQEANTASKD